MNDVAAHILREQYIKRIPDLSEPEFMKFVTNLFIRPNKATREGALLTRSLHLWLAKLEGAGGKGKQLLPVGVLIQGQLAREFNTTSQPPIILERDYPGATLEQAANIFQAQALALFRTEMRSSALGPDMTALMNPKPITTLNSEREGVDQTFVSNQQTMRARYANTVLPVLNGLVDDAEIVMFDSVKGRYEDTEKEIKIGLGNKATGLAFPSPSGNEEVRLLAIQIKARTVRKALEGALMLSVKMEKELQALCFVCSRGNGAVLFIGGGPTGTFSKNEVYDYLGRIGKPGGPSAVNSQVPYRDIDMGPYGVVIDKESFTQRSNEVFLLPMSLDIEPARPKTPTAKAFEGSNDTFEQSGHVLLPVFDADNFDPGFDDHPMIVQYQKGIHLPAVITYFRAIGIAQETEYVPTELIDAGDEWKRARNENTQVKEASAEDFITAKQVFSVPYGRECVLVFDGKDATLQVKDGKAYTNTVQCREFAQFCSMMSFAPTVAKGVLTPRDGRDFAPIDKIVELDEIPENEFGVISLFSDLEVRVFGVLEGELNAKMMALAMPSVKICRNQSENIVNETGRTSDLAYAEMISDELESGYASRLMLVQDTAVLNFYGQQTIDAAIIAFDIEGKNPSNGIVGKVVLGVNSVESVRIGKRSRRTELYSPIGVTSAFKGFSLEAKKKFFEHLMKHATHPGYDDGFLMVDPVESKLVVNVEYKGIDRQQEQPIFRHYTEMVDYKPESRDVPLWHAKGMGSFESTEKNVERGAIRGLRPPSKVPRNTYLAEVGRRKMPLLKSPVISSLGELVDSLDDYFVETEGKHQVRSTRKTPLSLPVPLEQIKRNGPEPVIGEFDFNSTGDEVSHMLFLSMNPPTENWSAHRQRVPWDFDQDAFDGTAFRTFIMDDPDDRRKAIHMDGWNRRYDDLQGVHAIAGKLKDSGKWHIQTIRVPRHYKLRRLRKEIKLDEAKPPKWYKELRPNTKPFGTKSNPPEEVPRFLYHGSPVSGLEVIEARLDPVFAKRWKESGATAPAPKTVFLTEKPYQAEWYALGGYQRMKHTYTDGSDRSFRDEIAQTTMDEPTPGTIYRIETKGINLVPVGHGGWVVFNRDVPVHDYKSIEQYSKAGVEWMTAPHVLKNPIMPYNYIEAMDKGWTGYPWWAIAPTIAPNELQGNPPFWQIKTSEDEADAHIKEWENWVRKLRADQITGAMDEIAELARLLAKDEITLEEAQARFEDIKSRGPKEMRAPKSNPKTPKGRKFPKRYLKGLNKVEKAIAMYEIDRGYEYDIDDPEAYEFWKSDIMAKAKGVKAIPSEHRVEFAKRYGPLPKGKDLPTKLAKATGIKKKFIKEAYKRGLAAWRIGHPPGVQQHQWASGRAYHFVLASDSTTSKGGPDFQLAVEAGIRDKGGKVLRNPVLPEKRFGSWGETAYSFDPSTRPDAKWYSDPQQNHDEIKEAMKEHEATITRYMRENYRPRWSFNGKPFKDDAEKKAFKEAQVYANTPKDEGGAGTPARVCPPGCIVCWREDAKVKENPIPKGMKKLEGAERPTGPFYHGTSMRLAKRYMEKGKEDKLMFWGAAGIMKGEGQLHESHNHPNAVMGMFVTKSASGSNSAMAYAKGAAMMEYHWEDNDDATPVLLEVLPDGLDFYRPPDTYLYRTDPKETFIVVTQGYDGNSPDTIPPENLRIAFVDEEFDPWAPPWDEEYGSSRPLPKENPPGVPKPGKELTPAKKREIRKKWLELVNMTKTELQTFYDSDWGNKKAGLSRDEAKEQGISSGRDSALAILKMKETSPKEWSRKKSKDRGRGIMLDYWQWAQKQINFNTRHRAMRGAYLDEKGRPNRKLLGLWIWGHDPWRYARKVSGESMLEAPDFPWVGRAEKKKYGVRPNLAKARKKKQRGTNKICPYPEKRKYSNRTDAMRAMKYNHGPQERQFMSVYECDVGGHYHYGHSYRINPLVLKPLYGDILAISGPSASGKSSIARGATKKLKGKMVPSYMTREKRPKERENIDGVFVSKEEFESMIEAGEFTTVEGIDLWVKQKSGEYYGRRAKDFLTSQPIIVDVNFEGLRLMRKAFPNKVYSVFIRTNMGEERRRQRLEKRGVHSPEEIEQRVKAGTSMLHSYQDLNFDFISSNKFGELEKNIAMISKEFRNWRNRALPNPPQLTKGTPVIHKPSYEAGLPSKLFFQSVEVDGDTTWYLFTDEEGKEWRITEEEIDQYSLYPTAPYYKANPQGGSSYYHGTTLSNARAIFESRWFKMKEDWATFTDSLDVAIRFGVIKWLEEGRDPENPIVILELDSAAAEKTLKRLDRIPSYWDVDGYYYAVMEPIPTHFLRALPYTSEQFMDGYEKMKAKNKDSHSWSPHKRLPVPSSEQYLSLVGNWDGNYIDSWLSDPYNDWRNFRDQKAHAPFYADKKANPLENPPVFDDPRAMDMGIQYGDKTGPNLEGKAANSKWHNQLLDGQMSTMPEIANDWKKKSFKAEFGLDGFIEKFGDDPRPYIVSLKIDGDSSLAHFNGKETVLWNKRGRWRRNFHVTDEITASLKKAGVKSAIIMGELYAVGEDGMTLSLKEVSSTILKPETIERQETIRFAAFDLIELNGKDTFSMPYHERMKMIPKLKGSGVMTVPMWVSKGGLKELKEAWDEGMKEPNFEGLILRYEGDPKSYKIKEKGTADLAVIGFYHGKAGGRDENIVGGGMLAWMLPNGDFIYAGKSVIGASIKEKEKLVPLLLDDAVKAPKAKLGGRLVDSSIKHDEKGKGTFTMVKPTMVGEFQYRGINWSEKPVFRYHGNEVKMVGSVKAPTMFQPSFVRWRTDKEIKPQDLRIEQIPLEGTGKWGQITPPLQNPPATNLDWEHRKEGQLQTLFGRDESGGGVAVRFNVRDGRARVESIGLRDQVSMAIDSGVLDGKRLSQKQISELQNMDEDGLYGLVLEDGTWLENLSFDASSKGKGYGQAAYLKLLDYADEVYSYGRSKKATRAWEALERRQRELGIVVERIPKGKGEAFLMRRAKQNPPGDLPEDIEYPGGHAQYLMDSILIGSITIDPMTGKKYKRKRIGKWHLKHPELAARLIEAEKKGWKGVPVDMMSYIPKANPPEDEDEEFVDIDEEVDDDEGYLPLEFMPDDELLGFDYDIEEDVFTEEEARQAAYNAVNDPEVMEYFQKATNERGKTHYMMVRFNWTGMHERSYEVVLLPEQDPNADLLAIFEPAIVQYEETDEWRKGLEANPPKKDSRTILPRIIVMKEWYTPELLRSNPNYAFLFGDNEQRKGKGGQAKIRDEPNAFGIRTKKSARVFWNDKNKESSVNMMVEDFMRAFNAGYDAVVIPADGIGTGLAELKQRAPNTWKWLASVMNELNRVAGMERGEPR